ncbi:ROK family protein [Marinilactibacillus sp. Marseille-P9653]|uniref:ROK family protein n=1 Tax=Marinilactibacillus sp. Marseille-P9653 TaxID=2866583 RepID=UPI001CE467E5|nr:ROK family protein [Marinilactibacillus sp. Marseille-P9653]
MLGAIEAGGTKFVCAISDEALVIKERITIPTTTPEETLGKVFEFFDQFELESMGIGSFGPIGVNKDSESYGYVTTTPKTAWKHTDFLGKVKERYTIPVGWTTDVNAAALGELERGAAKGKSSCIYLTVGTGIGGGAVVDGKPLEGFGHPEMGHVLVKMHPDDTFEGVCPYHKNCLEGLAAGPAIEKRYGKKAQELTDRKEVWEIEAFYLAQALMNYTLILSPEKIILGGGVMKQKQLFPLIRNEFKTLLNGYVETPDLDTYIIPPELGDDAGITGSLLLALKELEK